MYKEGVISLSFYPHNQPLKSSELQILTYLNARIDWSNEDQQNYLNLQKGYTGELKFYNFMQKELKTNDIQLYSLLLEEGNSVFQMDTLLISERTLYLFEIKNFAGDSYVKGEQWYAVSSRKEIRNPVHQLKRSEILLRQFLQKLDYHTKIEPYVVFINPEFTLYQAPIDLPIILPTQLNRLARKLNSAPSDIGPRHTELAKQLISAQADPTAYMKLPDYNFSELKKGILCSSCSRFLSYFNYKLLQCQHCGNKEDIETTVMRSVKEFSILFPEERITTRKIHEWCNIIESKKTIRRILQKNLQLIEAGKNSYYVFKPKLRHIPSI